MMRNLIRRWLSNQTVFIIVNTVFWLSLAAFLLTDALRLAIGGALMTLIGGGYLLYAGIWANVTRDLHHAKMTRTTAVILGLPLMLFSVALWVWIFSGGIQDGTIEQAYEPPSLPTDGASLWVITVTFVLPLALSWGTNCLWAKREHRWQQKIQQQGIVFPLIPQQRGKTLFVLFALSIVSLLMFASALNGERTGVTMTAGIGLPLLFSPLIIGCLYLLRSTSGMVVLDAEGVAIYRPGRKRFMQYQDIVEIQTKADLFSSWRLKGAKHTLRIPHPHRVHDLPRLQKLLRERISPSIKITRE